MKTFADLFPVGDQTIEAVAALETMIDQALEAAARGFVSGSPLAEADGKVTIPITYTTSGAKIELTHWRHAAIKYRAAGWSVTFAKDTQGRAVLLIAP
jgi:hypothetical protein